MYGHRSVPDLSAAGTELSLNAWTQQPNSLCWGLLVCIEPSVHTQAGSLQPCLGLHLLLVQSLPSLPALRAFSALPEQAHSPRHVHLLLDPQESVGASQSPSGHLVPQLFHLSHLVSLLFAPPVIHPPWAARILSNNWPWFFFFFPIKCLLTIAGPPWESSESVQIKTALSVGVFQGALR